MKKISFLTGFIIVCLFGATAYLSSCVHNACVARNVVCKNNGVCRDGDCICATGYEGDSCHLRVNEKFDGYYKVIRVGLINDSIADDDEDTLRIVAKNDKFGILFYTLKDSALGIIHTANVSNTTITIPSQDVLTSNLTGYGSLNADVISLTLNWTWPIGNKSKYTYAGTRYIPN